MMSNTIRRWVQALGKFFSRYSSLFLVLVLWELLVRLQILDYRFFPAPTTVIKTLYELTVSGEIIADTAISLQRMLIGFAIGSSGGLALGLIMGWSRFAERLIDPLISAFYPLPKTALLPLIMIIFGIGEASKVAIVAIAVFFTVVISTSAGVRDIEPVFLDAARNYGARGLRMFWKVVIPGSLPEIFTGLRLGWGISMVVIVAAEFVAANRGIGHTIWLAWGTLSTGTMYAGLIVIALIGLVSTVILQWAARQIMPWYAMEEKAGFRTTAHVQSRPLPFIPFLKRIPTGILDISRQYLYIIPPEAVLTKPVEESNGFHYEWIDSSNIASILPWKGQTTVHQFQRNLNRGMIGVFALHQKEAIGFMWGAVKQERDSLGCLHYPIEVGDAYMKGAEVRAEYRRKGVATALRYTMLSRVREMSPQWGVRRICGTVLIQNTPMMKLIERQGSVRIQELLSIRLTPYIFIRKTWDWDREGRCRSGAGRWTIRFKIPKFISDPRFPKLIREKIIKPVRAWQPKGNA